MAFLLRKSFINGFNREFKPKNCIFYIFQSSIMYYYEIHNPLGESFSEWRNDSIFICSHNNFKWMYKKKLKFSRGNQRWSKWTTIYFIGFLEISWNMKMKLWNLPSLTMLQFPPRQPAARVFPYIKFGWFLLVAFEWTGK